MMNSLGILVTSWDDVKFVLALAVLWPGWLVSGWLTR